MRAIRQTSGRPTEEVQRGELKKITPEIILQNTDNKLSKIEERTSKLIEKDKKQKENIETKKLAKLSSNSTGTITKLTRVYPATITSPQRCKSFHDFLSLPSRKIPRQILNYIKDHSYNLNGEWFSSIDSYELSELLGKSAHHLSDAISILKNNGWFDIINSSTAGSRTLKIKPEIYGLK